MVFKKTKSEFSCAFWAVLVPLDVDLWFVVLPGSRDSGAGLRLEATLFAGYALIIEMCIEIIVLRKFLLETWRSEVKWSAVEFRRFFFEYIFWGTSLNK